MKTSIYVTVFLLLLSVNGFSMEGRVIFLKGTAEIVKKGKSVSLKKNAVIREKDIIRTGNKSTLVIALDKGKKIKIKANSKFQIQNLNSNGLYKVKLYRGGLFAKVKRLTKDEKFQIKTVSMLAGVRGTQFYVHTLKSNSVWLCVNEGKVAVEEQKSKSKVLVKAGKGIHVESNKKIKDPKVFQWTKKLNWNMEKSEGDLEDKNDLEMIHKKWMEKKNK